MQELFFCDRNICRTVNSNGLVFLVAMYSKKLGIYDVHTMLHR